MIKKRRKRISPSSLPPGEYKVTLASIRVSRDGRRINYTFETVDPVTRCCIKSTDISRNVR